MRRPAQPREIPPPLELACLKALWNMGEGNVHEVQAVVTVDRPLAYTTVMTVLDRLTKRDAVSRRKVGRSFVYSPKLSRDALRRAALKELLADYFDGDEQALRQYLLGPRASQQRGPDNLDATLL